MNFDLVQTKELKIKQLEKYTEIPSIRLNPIKDVGNCIMKLNRKALEFLGASETKNRLILFTEFDISQQDEDSNVQSVLGVVADDKVKLDKFYKSCEIGKNTRTVISKNIYTHIIEQFGLNDKVTNYVSLHETGSHTGGAMTFKLITEEVEPEFNKGENVEITEEV